MVGFRRVKFPLVSITHPTPLYCLICVHCTFMLQIVIFFIYIPALKSPELFFILLFLSILHTSCPQTMRAAPSCDSCDGWLTDLSKLMIDAHFLGSQTTTADFQENVCPREDPNAKELADPDEPPSAFKSVSFFALCS